MIGALREKLKAQDVPFRVGVSAAAISTFRIGGPVALLIEPRCQGELIAAIATCHRLGVPYEVIGRASNLLFDDAPISVALVRTTALDAVRWQGSTLRCDCGISLSGLSALCARRGFADLAFACGIPGTLGGAVFMNAGAHGKEIAEMVRSVTVYHPKTDKIKTIFGQELNFSYRKSVFQTNGAAILSAVLDLSERREKAEIFAQMKALTALRRRTQPCELPSAGSVFRRTDADTPISRLLDELGFKGKRIGGAAVSEKHAGFIVNRGGATASDVRRLILEMQNTVERKKGFRPQTELRFVPSQYELFD